MTKIFAPIINKILCKLYHPKTQPQRCKSLFRKSKEHQDLSHYIFVRANKDDYNEILQVMHDAYYPDEPTCNSLGITHNTLLDESALSSLAEGTSLIARCKDDSKIVGACINETCHPWDPELKEKFACSVRCPKVKRLLLFYAYMQRKPDIWNKFSVQKVFEMSCLFVEKDHRHRGIAHRLLQNSKALAADCGYKVVRCDATSEYTAKLCEKIGMYRMVEIPYRAYVDSGNMEPIFKPAHPHEAAKVYVQVHPQAGKGKT